MQTVNKNGICGLVEEFDLDKLERHLSDCSIDHVDVFEATEENLEARKKLVGKKFNYKISRGFKKAPRIKR